MKKSSFSAGKAGKPQKPGATGPKAKAAPKAKSSPKPPKQTAPSESPVPHAAKNGLSHRLAVHRINRIMEAIGQGEYPNCTTLAAEFEMKPRTVVRDIAYLKNILRAPIDFDTRRNGYYFTEKNVSLPGLCMTTGELASLLIATRALESYRGLPFEPALRSAFEKLTSQMTDKVSFDWSDLRRAISFAPSGVQVNMSLEIFELLGKAVFGREELEVVYNAAASQDGTGPKTRRIWPLHLATIGGAWYVFVHDLLRGEDRTFAVSRISAARHTGNHFTPPVDFDPKARISGSVGAWGGIAEPVRLRVRGTAVRLLQERSWHASQKVNVQKDKTAEVTMKVAINPEFEHWVLQWGSEMQVLEPQRLREAVERHARRMLEAW